MNVASTARPVRFVKAPQPLKAPVIGRAPCIQVEYPSGLALVCEYVSP